ncbi:DUF5789 family protein [Haloarchaeobius sp. DFWS5]|uniref:DUF5789 family protein n=1 Tax=Haloarchaeobius sp. DFWS5 TaxID=3446114 RepID=UPI003EB9D6E2
MTDTDDRQQGIDFGSLDDELDAFDYPVSRETVVEQCGDVTLDLPKGETTVSEVLSHGEGEATYESPEAVRSAVLNLVGSDAVGQEGYSDRGPGSESR